MPGKMLGLLAYLSLFCAIGFGSGGFGTPPKELRGNQYQCVFESGAKLLGAVPFLFVTDSESPYVALKGNFPEKGQSESIVGKLTKLSSCPRVPGYRCSWGYTKISTDDTFFAYEGEALASGKPEGDLLLAQFKRDDQDRLLFSTRRTDSYRCNLLNEEAPHDRSKTH